MDVDSLSVGGFNCESPLTYRFSITVGWSHEPAMVVWQLFSDSRSYNMVDDLVRGKSRYPIISSLLNRFILSRPRRGQACGGIFFHACCTWATVLVSADGSRLWMWKGLGRNDSAHTCTRRKRQAGQLIMSMFVNILVQHKCSGEPIEWVDGSIAASIIPRSPTTSGEQLVTSRTYNNKLSPLVSIYTVSCLELRRV